MSGERKPLRTRARRDDGASSVEYAILAVSIAAVIVGAVVAIGLWLPGGFQQVLDGWP